MSLGLPTIGYRSKWTQLIWLGTRFPFFNDEIKSSLGPGQPWDFSNPLTPR